MGLTTLGLSNVYIKYVAEFHARFYEEFSYSIPNVLLLAITLPAAWWVEKKVDRIGHRGGRDGDGLRAAFCGAARASSSSGGSAACPREVTAQPEILPPPCEFVPILETVEDDNGTMRRDRRAPYDSVDVLPSWRGQYHKKR